MLAGLRVFPDPFLRSMGLAGIGVTAVVVAAAPTLLPALLALVGHRVRPATPTLYLPRMPSGSSGGVLVFVKDTAEAVTPVDVQAGQVGPSESTPWPAPAATT